jgi:hypothetical protein
VGLAVRSRRFEEPVEQTIAGTWFSILGQLRAIAMMVMKGSATANTAPAVAPPGLQNHVAGKLYASRPLCLNHQWLAQEAKAMARHTPLRFEGPSDDPQVTNWSGFNGLDES